MSKTEIRRPPTSTSSRFINSGLPWTLYKKYVQIMKKKRFMYQLRIHEQPHRYLLLPGVFPAFLRKFKEHDQFPPNFRSGYIYLLNLGGKILRSVSLVCVFCDGIFFFPTLKEWVDCYTVCLYVSHSLLFLVSIQTNYTVYCRCILKLIAWKIA